MNYFDLCATHNYEMISYESPKFYVPIELNEMRLDPNGKFTNWPLCFCQANEIKTHGQNRTREKSEQIKLWIDAFIIKAAHAHTHTRSVKKGGPADEKKRTETP